MALYIGDKIIAGSFKTGASWKVGDIGSSVFGIDESLNDRRYLNGQVISQAQFVQFTAFLKSRVSVYPSLATTEVNWQATVTNSDLGQCGQFVIDDVAGTIRLPKVVNIQGLMDLTSLGTTTEAGLPNITGGFDKKFVLYEDTGTITGSGAFSKTETTTNVYHGWNSHTGINADLKIDASDSSTVYGNSTTVQQEAVQYPYFIQVATGVETSIDVSREIELNNPFYFGQSMYSASEPNNASWLVSGGQWNSGTTYHDFYEWLLQIQVGTLVVSGVSVKLSTETYDDYDYVINTGDTTFRLPLLNGEEDLAGNSREMLNLPSSGNTITATKNGEINLIGINSTSYKRLNLENQTNGMYENFSAPADSGSYGGISIKVKKGDVVKVGYYGYSSYSLYLCPADGNGTLYFYVGETIQDANIIADTSSLTLAVNIFERTA